jgi:hypothetical protein
VRTSVKICAGVSLSARALSAGTSSAGDSTFFQLARSDSFD